MIREELVTTTLFTLRLEPSTRSIYGVFPDESDREAHLSSRGDAALKGNTSELFVEEGARNRAGRRHRRQTSWIDVKSRTSSMLVEVG